MDVFFSRGNISVQETPVAWRIYYEKYDYRDRIHNHYEQCRDNRELRFGRVSLVMSSYIYKHCCLIQRTFVLDIVSFSTLNLVVMYPVSLKS